MRTTKRFTPAVLARFERQGRGEGTHQDYIGWHRVTRGDPASRGRSHMLNWRGRLRDLLSDGELGEQYFATMIPYLDDSLEQFPLSTEDDTHPLAAYGERDTNALYPGTVRLATEMGIKHPKVSDSEETALWKSTTDLLLVLKPPGRPRELLALAFKPNDWAAKRRTRELLALEREFWIRRKVTWLLITPALYDPKVVLTLRRIACWALTDRSTLEHRQLACHVALADPGSSVTQILQRLSAITGAMESAQRALWQAIWNGDLPIDLSRGWRPHLPFRHMDAAEFMNQNPVASRRSSWS